MRRQPSAVVSTHNVGFYLPFLRLGPQGVLSSSFRGGLGLSPLPSHLGQAVATVPSLQRNKMNPLPGHCGAGCAFKGISRMHQRESQAMTIKASRSHGAAGLSALEQLGGHMLPCGPTPASSHLGDCWGPRAFALLAVMDLLKQSLPQDGAEGFQSPQATPSH